MADELQPMVTCSNFHMLPEIIRRSFITKLNSSLRREFPIRKDVTRLTLVDRSRLYSTVSEVITSSLDVVTPITFSWFGQAVSVTFKDFKFLDLPQPLFGAVAKSIPDMFVEKFMKEDRNPPRRRRQRSKQTLNYSDRESLSPSSHAPGESHYISDGAGEETLDCRGGGAMELHSRSEAEALQPSASGGFPSDFAMQPDVKGNFTVDINNKFWIESEWDEDFSDVDGRGGGEEEAVIRKDKDWDIGQESDVHFEGLPPSQNVSIGPCCSSTCPTSPASNTNDSHQPLFWGLLPDIVKLPFVKQDDQGLGCMMNQLSACDEDRGFIMDVLRPFKHFIKGDVFVMHPCPPLRLFLRSIHEASPGVISSAVLFIDNPVVVKHINNPSSAPLSCRSRRDRPFPIVAKDLNEESACAYVQQNPHHFDCFIHADAVDSRLVQAGCGEDDFKCVLDGTLNLLKTNRIGFVFFKHRRFVDFAVDYLSSLSLNGTPEVVPVPRNKSAACPSDSSPSSRRKRAALDNGEDDAAAASSSPAAIDSYEGYWLILRT